MIEKLNKLKVFVSKKIKGSKQDRQGYLCLREIYLMLLYNNKYNLHLQTEQLFFYTPPPTLCCSIITNITYIFRLNSCPFTPRPQLYEVHHILHFKVSLFSLILNHVLFSIPSPINMNVSALYMVKEEWVSDCCLMPNEQFFSYIMVTKKNESTFVLPKISKLLFFMTFWFNKHVFYNITNYIIWL